MFRARAVSFVMLALLCCLFAFGCSDQPLTETSEAVRKTLEHPGKLHEWKEADIYGGRALLTSDGNYGYWVKDGVVYAANGAAKRWALNVPYAPVSIGLDEIKKAVEGKAFPLPPHLGFSVREVPERFSVIHTGSRKEIIPVPAFGVEEGKDIMVWHAPKVKNEDSRGEIWLEEKGGMITKVRAQAELRVKPSANDKDFNLQGQSILASSVGLVFPDEGEFEEAFQGTLNAAFLKGEIKENTMDFKGAHIAAERYTDPENKNRLLISITITPAAR